MSKIIPMTPSLTETIRYSLGDREFDVSQVSVFEARFVTTEPVKKRGTLWEGGTLSPSVLRGMEEFISKEGNAIPMYVMHDTGELPSGKVFSARMFELPNGEIELRGQFYIPNSDAETIDKIQTAVVDEVSVQVVTEKLLCSECGFDYLSDEADMMNYFTRTCNEGHTVGTDGVHVRGVGLVSWVEVSLCGIGAATKAKIMGRSNHKMSEETKNRLAASNKNWEAGLFELSMKIEDQPKGENKMSTEFATLHADYKAVLAEKSQLDVKLSMKEEEINALKSGIEDLKVKLTESEALVARLQEEVTADEAKKAVEEAEKKADEAEKELLEAAEKLAPHVKAALVATGVTSEVPTKLSEMVKAVEDAGLKLHQTFGGEGKSTTQSNDAVSEREKLKAKLFQNV